MTNQLKVEEMYGSLRIYIFAISDYDVSSFKFLIGDLGKQVSSSKDFH